MKPTSGTVYQVIDTENGKDVVSAWPTFRRAFNASRKLEAAPSVWNNFTNSFDWRYQIQPFSESEPKREQGVTMNNTKDKPAAPVPSLVAIVGDADQDGPPNYRPQVLKVEKAQGGPAGRRLIFVDGTAWGQIEMERRGAHGAKYVFYDTAWGPISKPAPTKTQPVRVRAVEVWGDKAHKRDFRDDARTLEQRLHDKAQELINAGLLQSPEAVRAKIAEDSAAWRARRDAAEEQANKQFEDKAADVLGGLRGYDHKHATAETVSADVAAVVAAMKWAQTR